MMNPNLNPKVITEFKLNAAGDLFFFGAKGSGKTCKMLALTQLMLSRGLIRKVWDMFGGDRDEGPFWAFPNTDHNLWRELEDETFKLKVPGPKQYRVTLLYPMFTEQLPEKLPEDLPNVKTKVFTIPFKKIDKKYMGLVIGQVGREAESLWDSLQQEAYTLLDIKFLMETKYSKLKKTHFYKTFVRPLLDNNFIASDDGKLNLNVLEQAEETDRISILCLDYVPKEFHFLVMGYIVDELFNLVKRSKTHNKHFMLFREASRFMKVVDADKNNEDRANAFRNLLVDKVRYGRSGVYFGLDTQDASEVRGLIDGQQEILGLCEMPSQNSIEMTCKPLERAGRMNPNQTAYIQWMIKKHQICIVQRGKHAIILNRINPPRSQYWKPEHGHFIRYWKQQKDKWVNLGEFIKSLDNEKIQTVKITEVKIKKSDEVVKSTDDDEDLSDFEKEEEEKINPEVDTGFEKKKRQRVKKQKVEEINFDAIEIEEFKAPIADFS